MVPKQEDLYKETRAIAEQANNGEISALNAAQQIVSLGKLLIGTAVSIPSRIPGIPMTCDNGIWQPVITNSRGGLEPIVWASRVPEAVVWSALSGDVNTPRQRDVIQAGLLPEDKIYDLSVTKYIMGASGRNTYYIHEDLEKAVEHLADDHIIGAVDVVDTQEETIAITHELETYGLRREADTVASFAVRMGDVRQIPYETYYYKPLSV